MRAIPIVLLASVLPLAGLHPFDSTARAEAGSIAAAALHGVPTTRIRVLLFEADGRVVVSDRRGAHEIVAVADGVRVGGGPVRADWRSDWSDAPLQVRSSSVRGAIEVVPLGGEKLAVVNEVPLESYLQGTLGAEMYASWSSAALQAQAVASRTYALRHMRERNGQIWHVRAGTQSQVYGGVSAESDAVRRAVRATEGEILVHGGEPILAAFHSSSGGQTASSKEVWGTAKAYLVSAAVEDDWESPDAYWRAEVSRGTLGRAVASVDREIGPIHDAAVLERTSSGRVARLRLTGDRGAVTLSGTELRRALGETTLKSTLFEVKGSHDGFVFVGSGSGHGVGMSQWGARAMALRGDSYRDILRAFYPGAALRSMLDTPVAQLGDVSTLGDLR